MTNWKDVKSAIELGTDAVGFLVGITHLAEDKISVDEAAEIIKKVLPFVPKVAVTHYEDSGQIIPMLKYLNVDTVQLHSDISVEEIRKVRSSLPYIKIIKLVSVVDRKAVETAKEFMAEADALLLDSRTEDRLGGTGVTHDWSISRQIVKEASVPVILAGGLCPENLLQAINEVRPWGVDVNSGVEINGNKDFERMKKFIQIAHSTI